jgi:hypothetical protein
MAWCSYVAPLLLLLQVLEPKDGKAVYEYDRLRGLSVQALCHVLLLLLLLLQVLEPKDGKVVYKDWDHMGSEIGQLETFDDDEQPLPQNVSAAMCCGFVVTVAAGVVLVTSSRCHRT